MPVQLLAKDDSASVSFDLIHRAARGESLRLFDRMAIFHGYDWVDHYHKFQPSCNFHMSQSPCPMVARTSPDHLMPDNLVLPEIPKPEELRDRGGLYFDAGGLDILFSVDETHSGADVRRHFGLACADLAGLRTRLQAAGV